MEKNRTGGSGRTYSPCARFILWIFACLGITLLSLLIAFVAWTILSYHDSLVSLQNRVGKLEKECSEYKNNINKYVDTRVQKLIQEVSTFIPSFWLSAFIFWLTSSHLEAPQVAVSMSPSEDRLDLLLSQFPTWIK